jgi:hypothetical protein
MTAWGLYMSPFVATTFLSLVPPAYVHLAYWVGADFDCGERVVEELAPELLPMLTTLEMPANFVPATNEVRPRAGIPILTCIS